MFGYVKPKISELRVKEYELYKSVYCGLCRCMGEKVCRSSNLTLSYDMVFLALVRIAVAGDAASVSRRRCAVHPVKKRPVLDICPSLEYSARAGTLLAFYNLLDDINDKKGMSKAASAAALPLVKRMRRKAGLPELDRDIADKLKELSALEKSGEESLDRVADVFGELLGNIFSHGIEEKAGSRIAYQIGFHTGRWIYMTDAADDLAEDRKKGSYNPLLLREESEEQSLQENLRCAMLLELDRISKAIELIDYQDNGIKNIIYNIVFTGMTEKTDDVLRPEKTEEEKKDKGKYAGPDERIKI